MVTNDDDLPVLHERTLMYFAPENAGWVADLTRLSDAAEAELREKLSTRMPAFAVDQVLRDLALAFPQAVEVAKVELRLAREAELSSEARKPSAKLGVLLRSRIDDVRATLQADPIDPQAICATILAEPMLERLVTPFLEERMGFVSTDPLSYAAGAAVRYLPVILDMLRCAIDAGVTTGRTAPSHDHLATAVVDAIERATGARPKRNWDAYANEESGAGLDCCRILARELNQALPADLRRNEAADMAKAFRRAVGQVRGGT